MKPTMQVKWEHLGAAAVGAGMWWMLIKLVF